MWDNLKASIASVVRTNNNQEITGENLQNVLNTIVNTVGANATFAGIAAPSTNPGTPDGSVFYIAYEPGVYSNFNITTVDGLYILENKTGSWVGTRISTTGTSGTTFTPHVNSDGDISWTNDGGKPNPETVNIKGPKGDTVILGEGTTYKLYNNTGQNTDGAMTQKAITDKIAEIEVDTLPDNVAYLGDDDGQATTIDFDPQADTVWNKAQTLSSAQQQQARENIGAAGINDIAGMQVVNHGTSDTTFALTPNKFHVWSEVASLTLTFATGEVGYIQEYIFQFTSGSTATTLNLPSSVKWITDNTVEANKTYQVSILNSLAVMGGA